MLLAFGLQTSGRGFLHHFFHKGIPLAAVLALPMPLAVLGTTILTEIDCFKFCHDVKLQFSWEKKQGF